MMILKEHPLIAHRDGKTLYDRAETHTALGPFEEAVKTCLLRYEGVPREITGAVLRDLEAPLQTQMNEVSARQKAYLDAASDEDLIALMLERAVCDGRHADITVWAKRVDETMTRALGIPANTVIQGMEGEASIPGLAKKVHASYVAVGATPSLG